MTKSELIESLSKRQSQLAYKDVELAVKTILEHMAQTLSNGERIEIRGFGSFSLHFRPPRVGRNPKSGEPVSLPAKYVPHFKPGKQLRERVDSSTNEITGHEEDLSDVFGIEMAEGDEIVTGSELSSDSEGTERPFAISVREVVAKASLPVLVDAIGRMMRVEAKAAARVRKQGNSLTRWGETYFSKSDHAITVRATLIAPIESMAEAVRVVVMNDALDNHGWESFVGAFTKRAVGRHMALSAIVFNDQSDENDWCVDGWWQSEAVKRADSIVVDFLSAIKRRVGDEIYKHHKGGNGRMLGDSADKVTGNC